MQWARGKCGGGKVLDCSKSLKVNRLAIFGGKAGDVSLSLSEKAVLIILALYQQSA